MRRAAFALGALLVVAAGVAGFAHFVTSPLVRRYHPPEDRIAIPADPEAIAHGGHLVAAVAVCVVCHGDDLGGKLAFADSFLGRGYTPNLTAGKGGVGATYSDADWVRAIRYGIRPDGTAIPFMPVDFYNDLDDADLGAVIAFLKSLPPVDNTRTRVELTLPARLMIDMGLVPGLVRAGAIDMQAPRHKRAADPGAYLVRLGGCTFCHGPDLRGGQGPEPGAPAGQDLTRTGPMASWSESDFRTALRTGAAPNGHAIAPKYMPWMGYRAMTDAEIASIWAYLRTL